MAVITSLSSFLKPSMDRHLHGLSFHINCYQMSLRTCSGEFNHIFLDEFDKFIEMRKKVSFVYYLNNSRLLV